MKAIRAERPGGPEVMKLVEEPTPDPGPGEALIRVEACGVNFIDVYHRTGAYAKPPPIPLGLEGAGVVEAVGPEVAELAPGAWVAWTGVPGSYATHVVAPAGQLVALPDGVDARHGAAAMLQGMTAHYLTHSTYALRAGDACLIHAAAGGVGLLLCQLARRAGARAIGTVSTAAKAEAARAAGCDDVILYKERDFVAETRKLTDGRGVQVVYDSVGATTFDGSLQCLAPRGMLVLFGQASGPVPPLDPQRLNQGGSLYLTRPSLFHYIATRDELVARARDVLGWVERGELRLTIGEEHPLADAPEAHRRLEARKTSGKVLLIP